MTKVEAESYCCAHERGEGDSDQSDNNKETEKKGNPRYIFKEKNGIVEVGDNREVKDGS